MLIHPEPGLYEYCLSINKSTALEKGLIHFTPSIVGFALRVVGKEAVKEAEKLAEKEEDEESRIIQNFQVGQF